MRPRCFFLLLFTIFTLLAFCAGCDSNVAKVGEQAPPVSGKDIHGAPLSLAAVRGKVVVLYFWTNSCCGGSLKESLEPVFQRNKDKGLAVIAVNEYNAPKEVASLAVKDRLSLPILLDSDSTWARDYLVFAYPTAFIIDHNGIVRQKILGQVSAAKLEQLVLKQLEIHQKTEAEYEKTLHR